MFYEKIELGSTLRVIECPKCKNEEFGKDAYFCRICGSHLHNKCEGEWNDRDEYVVQHDNPGNARFCETCGKPTYFFTNGFLDAWEKVQKDFDPHRGLFPTVATSEDEIPL